MGVARGLTEKNRYRLLKGVDFKKIEDAIKDLYLKLGSKADKSALDALAELLKKLRAEFDSLVVNTNENTREINALRAKFELLETKFLQLSRSVTDLAGRLDKGGRPTGDNKPKELFGQSQGAHIEEDEWNELKKSVLGLKKDIADIFKELEALKDVKKRLFTLEARMEGKLDKEEFEKWKAENDFNHLIQGLLKKFADKNEILKALKKLESRIAILEEFLRETGPGLVDSAENALLAKKPLGGWSCASCQKDLINIEGMKVQYYPWAKLPQRNPTERIAKVGQGFSRMLSMLKPELITKSQQVGLVQRRGYEEDPRTTIEEEGVRTHGQGFGQPAHEVKRPSTANVFPGIPHAKV